MRGVLYRTEKDGTTLAVPELRISASNSRTVYYENNAAKQSALNNNEIREGSIVLTGLAGNNEDYATKAYVDSKIGNLEHQVGVIVGFPGNVPNGYLLCDGSRFDKNKYPELYEYLGTDVLPDYRECVLVGAGQNTTNNIATHDVYTVGQFKDDQIQNITGDLVVATAANRMIANGVFAGTTYTGSDSLIGTTGGGVYHAKYTFDASTVARAGTTTHGKQKGLNWAIKAAPITISSSPIQYQEGDLLKLKQQPDWDNAITLTAAQLQTGYTVPADGIICISGNPAANTRGYISVNGNIIASGYAYSPNDYRECQAQIQVNEGDIVRTVDEDKNGQLWILRSTPLFVPFKTVAEPLTLPVNVMNNPSLPDYSRAVAVSSLPYTAPKDGMILGNCTRTTNGITSLFINGLVCARCDMNGSSYSSADLQLPVGRGDTLTDDNGNIGVYLHFVPYKA